MYLCSFNCYNSDKTLVFVCISDLERRRNYYQLYYKTHAFGKEISKVINDSPSLEDYSPGDSCICSHLFKVEIDNHKIGAYRFYSFLNVKPRVQRLYHRIC